MKTFMIYDEQVDESGQDALWIDASTLNEALVIAKEEFGMIEPAES